MLNVDVNVAFLCKGTEFHLLNYSIHSLQKKKKKGVHYYVGEGILLLLSLFGAQEEAKVNVY